MIRITSKTVPSILLLFPIWSSVCPHRPDRRQQQLVLILSRSFKRWKKAHTVLKLDWTSIIWFTCISFSGVGGVRCCLLSDRFFRNFRASTSGDRRILCCRAKNFEVPKLWKGRSCSSVLVACPVHRWVSQSVNARIDWHQTTGFPPTASRQFIST